MKIPDFPSDGPDESKYQWVAIVATYHYLRNQFAPLIAPIPTSKIEPSLSKISTPWQKNEKSHADIASRATEIRQNIVEALNIRGGITRARLFAPLTTGSRDTQQYEDCFSGEFTKDPVLMQVFFDHCWNSVSADFIKSRI